MFGSKNSLMTLLKKDCPRLFTMKYICHSLALCVSYACTRLPNDLEELLSHVYCYLKYSTNRRQNIQQLQGLLNTAEHKILKMQKVRWLSLQAVVDRFVEQYDVLFKDFEKESDTGNTKAMNIFKKLKTKFNLLYFLKFLKSVLPLITQKNLEFQAESTKVHQLHSKMESLYRTILGMYLNDHYLNKTPVT